MHGDAAHRLTLHAKRTLALPRLPPYQAELVRDVTREVSQLNGAVNAILQPFAATGRGFDPAEDQGTACTLLVNHMGMRRNKRCLLAYHTVRVRKLEEACWEGKVDELLAGTPELRGYGQDVDRGQTMNEDGNVSPEEEEYARQYAELLAAYKGLWTDIDLTGSLEPPTDLFVDVRVLKDAGEIQTEYGCINLTRNSQFYVRHGDVERLIAQGYLQRLDR